MVALLLLIGLAGTALGDETLEEAKYIYHMNQRIEGDGFFRFYQNVTAGNLRMDKTGHGAGDYEHESILYSQNEAKYDSAAHEYTLLDERIIDFNETAAFVYRPMSLNLGNSFQSGAFRSLGKEDVSVKNYGPPQFVPEGVCMNALVDSASTFKKDLSAYLFFRSIDAGNESEIDYEALYGQASITKLNVSTSFTGIGHFGAMELNESLHRVSHLIDEDYIGTFSIEKKMNHTFIYSKSLEADDWLPCCSGGYLEMPTYYRKGARGFGSNVAAVFDCTCFKAPMPTSTSA